MNVNPGKTEFTEAEVTQLRLEVRAKVDERLTQAEIGRQADVKSSTLSQFLSGSYPGDPGPIAEKLYRWLRTREIAEEVRRRLPVTPDFIPLQRSAAITGFLQYAREAGRIVMVAGSPGVSKTSTARQYQADTARTWYAPMDSTCSGAPSMLIEVLIAMGTPDPKGPPNILLRQICVKAAEAKGLLIIDEAQHLSDKAIEALRAINDRCRLGVALLGNEAVYTQVGPTGVKARFAQVSSRFAKRTFIVEPDPRDAAALAHAWAQVNGEVIGEREVRFCQEIAARPGGLRNIEMTFESALLAARGAGEPIGLLHLQAGWAQQSGAR